MFGVNIEGLAPPFLKVENVAKVEKIELKKI